MTDEQLEPLKDCPFCGSDDVNIVITAQAYAPDLFNGYCLQCYASSARSLDWLKAIAAWNRRAT